MLSHAVSRALRAVPLRAPPRLPPLLSRGLASAPTEEEALRRRFLGSDRARAPPPSPADAPPPNDSDDPDDPPVTHRVPLLSRADFAARPAVGFDNTFASYEDAGIVFSHLGHDTADEMYDAYRAKMEEQRRDPEVQAGRLPTSHDAAVRELAREYGVHPDRAAAVVALCHSEQRLRELRPDLVNDKLGRFTDGCAEAMLEHEYGPTRRPPGHIGEGGIVESRVDRPKHAPRYATMVRVPDGTDLSALERAAAIREGMAPQRAYAPDIDPHAVRVDLDTNAEELLAAAERQLAPAGPKKEQRWKFAAKLTDTQQQKKRDKLPYYVRRAQATPENVLVEEKNRGLRRATLAEERGRTWRTPAAGGVFAKLLEEPRAAFVQDTLGRAGDELMAAEKGRAPDFARGRVRRGAWGGAAEEWVQRRARWGTARKRVAPPPPPEGDGGGGSGGRGGGGLAIPPRRCCGSVGKNARRGRPVMASRSVDVQTQSSQRVGSI